MRRTRQLSAFSGSSNGSPLMLYASSDMLFSSNEDESDSLEPPIQFLSSCYLRELAVCYREWANYFLTAEHRDWTSNHHDRDVRSMIKGRSSGPLENVTELAVELLHQRTFAVPVPQCLHGAP